jgi:hypothetical protein
MYKPNIQGTIVPQAYDGNNGNNIHCLVSGAFEAHSTTKFYKNISASSGVSTVGAKLNASLHDRTYTGAGKVCPLSFTINFIIKF